MSFNSKKQSSFGDLYEQAKDWAQNDKPQFLEMLDQYLDLSEFLPSSFYSAYYKYFGRKREYGLESMLSAFILQKILGIPTLVLLVNIFALSSDLRDFCGFKSVPDISQFSRFKTKFEDHLEDLFYHLVDVTEPLCRKIDPLKSDLFIYDTTGFEPYVTENNPKYINNIIRRLKNIYKKDKNVNIYAFAYQSMPSSAQVNQEIKQLYINGHFCYVYKAGIVTNGLGVIRHISFFDDEFKDNHPEIPVEKKSDSPDEDKSIGDSTSLKPVLEDYFNLHNHHYSTFIADSAFDNYQTYPFLIKDFSFDKAVIPLNSRNTKSDMLQPEYNENGWPLCPKDSSLPMKPNGWCRGKNRSPRFKFVCPKTNHKGGKRNCYCEDPCTDSSYGRVTYTYPDQDLRTYPGIIRNTDDWIDLYKKRGVVEQTINYFKDAMVTGNLKTQNLKSIKADVFLAGITQLLTLILADKMDKPENIRSLRSLIA
jgi:hypothetical protein